MQNLTCITVYIHRKHIYTASIDFLTGLSLSLKHIDFRLPPMFNLHFK